MHVQAAATALEQVSNGTGAVVDFAPTQKDVVDRAVLLSCTSSVTIAAEEVLRPLLNSAARHYLYRRKIAADDRQHCLAPLAARVVIREQLPTPALPVPPPLLVEYVQHQSSKELRSPSLTISYSYVSKNSSNSPFVNNVY